MQESPYFPVRLAPDGPDAAPLQKRILTEMPLI
jgi:hypothetical protein